MTRKERILLILEDAVKKFQLPVNDELFNSTGICNFAYNHPLLAEMPGTLRIDYIDSILSDGLDRSFYFWDPQHSMSLNEVNFYQRSNWCKKRIKELKAE